MADKEKQADGTRALVAEALRSVRWNQSKLAAAAGISQPALNLFLTGKRGLSKDALARVLGALETALQADQDRILGELQAMTELCAGLAFRAKVNALRPPRITRAQAAQIRRKANATFKAESPAPEKKCGHAPNHEEVIA